MRQKRKEKKEQKQLGDRERGMRALTVNCDVILNLESAGVLTQLQQVDSL